MTRNRLFLVCSMAAAAFAVSSCTAFGLMPTGTACEGDADDGIACTVDVCAAAGGAYQHIPNDALCASGEMCSVTAGCVDRDPACPASCDDGIACTVDSCVSGACRHTANDSLCSSGTCRASATDGATGCYVPPTDEGCETNADCVDTVSCTTNRCESGECVYSPNDSACPTGQMCSATAGCVDETPPTADFECAVVDGANRIGYSVRLCTRGMSGVHTIPDVDGATQAMPAGATSMRAWGLGSDVPAGGCRDYSLAGILGGINTHPFINEWRVASSGHPEWDRDILNVADFRSFVGDSAASVGLEAFVCQRAAGCSSSQWVELPEAFYTIAHDTVSARFWSEDPNLHSSIRGSIAIRAVLQTACDAGRPAP